MDDFNDAKKDVLHCLGVVSSDIVDLTNCPTKLKTDLIIRVLYEIMRKLSDMAI